MVRSMTGYGRGHVYTGGLGLSLEIKTINHRHFDLFIRQPKEFLFWEEELRSRLKKVISRGRVEIGVFLEEVPDGSYVVKINQALAHAYYQALEKIRSSLPLEGKVDLPLLVKFPDLLVVENHLSGDKFLAECMGDALDQALHALLRQREREGSYLRQDLEERCLYIEKCVREMEERSGMVVEEYRLRLQQKLADLSGGAFEEGRILMECAIIADRSSIAEELTRLKSHLAAFSDAFGLAEPVGRKLDFILQEMFREANTIGSKANDYALSSLAVEIKATLEKMREQVQNIE